MSFRDLKSFNIAMLGKQIWRIIQFPNSLLSCVFKAKYFPHTDVLDATPKSNASYTLKSICAASSLMRAGIRWRVGSGDNIDVWKDNWIPRDFQFKPRTPNLINLMNLNVADLRNEEGCVWNLEAVNNLFWEEDVQSIWAIPVVSKEISDIRIWHYYKCGVYTVRTGYYLCRELAQRNVHNRMGTSSLTCSMDWNWIWRVNAPNKIRVFLWHLVNDSLPILVNLESRHVVNEVICPVCLCKSESALHLFRDCHYARCF